MGQGGEQGSEGVREGAREGGEEIERERKGEVMEGGSKGRERRGEDSIVVPSAGGMCRRVRGRNWRERGR